MAKEPQTNDVHNTLFAPSSKEAQIQKKEEFDWKAYHKEQEEERKAKNIFAKMQEAKVTIQDRIKGKSGRNEYSNFDYLQLQDFLPITNEVFDDLKLFSKFVVKTEFDTNGVANDTAYLTIINIDNPEEKIVYSSRMADAVIKGNSPIQLLGGAHTFMRRYLYVEALDIAVGDTLDKEVGSGNIITNDKKMISPQSRGILEKLCAELPDKEVDMLKKYNVNMITELTQEQALQAIRAMQIYKKKAQNNGNGNQSFGQ